MWFTRLMSRTVTIEVIQLLNLYSNVSHSITLYLHIGYRFSPISRMVKWRIQFPFCYVRHIFHLFLLTRSSFSLSAPSSNTSLFLLNRWRRRGTSYNRFPERHRSVIHFPTCCRDVSFSYIFSLCYFLFIEWVRWRIYLSMYLFYLRN